jgi:hypothetical protein
MEMKKTLTITFAILLLISSWAIVSATTGSIGNAKMVLYPEVNGWTNTVIEKTILVRNVNDVPMNITLKTDANASKFIELVDETFILAPGEEKKAGIEIKVRKVGTYTGSVNVFFKPTEGKDAGVVLSSTIVVIAKKNTGYEEDDTGDDTNTNPDTNTDNNSTTGDDNGITGDVSNTNGPSKIVKIWGISTFILLVVLLVLLYIWGKKRSKSKNKRKYK